MITNHLQSSLRNKLLVAFLLIGFVPYALFLGYTLILSEHKMLAQIVQEKQEKAQLLADTIATQLLDMQKNLHFLSHLDVMDELLSDDIDKRISRLLTQKKEDYNLDITFLLLNEENTVIASSDKSALLSSFSVHSLLTKKKGINIVGKTAYMQAPVYASFDKTKRIGLLILRYNLENLTHFLTQKAHIHTALYNPEKKLTIGYSIAPDPLKLHVTSSDIGTEHIKIYKNIDTILKGWYIIYAIDKNIALNSLYDFIRFMLYMAPLIVLVIVIVALKYSASLMRPIIQLTHTANTVVKTKDYNHRLSVNSTDEISTLTKAFNTMLETTQHALDALQEESKLRLKRFSQLIETFNTIATTKSEHECIQTSIKQLRELTQNEHLAFYSATTLHNNAIALKVYDVESNKEEIVGYIAIDVSTLDDPYERQFYHSIAAMVSLQIDRIRLIDKTLAASNAKSAFISNMSHELRTPLNAIIGFSQYLITYEELNEEQQDVVSNIESSAQYLLSLINEILDIAKIESGKMEVHKQMCSPLSIVKNGYTMLLALAEDKGIALNLHVENFEDRDYCTDEKVYQQIVLNLLSNAIKFTKEGSVDIYLYEETKRLVFKVVDSGIGLEEASLKSLFNDFTQVENVMQKEHKGTGLGLSLSRKLARLLGGDVYLQSDGINHGTRAYFVLEVNSENTPC